MRITSLLVVLSSIWARARAHDICACTDTCCVIDNSTSVSFTGKSIVSLTHPQTSLTGEYANLDYLDAEGAQVLSNYQYVIQYMNAYRSTFDRNVLMFSDVNLTCAGSHMIYETQTAGQYKTIPFVEVVRDGTQYCTLDVNSKLSRDEIAQPGHIYFALDYAVREGDNFFIMYDETDAGLIIPEDDIIVYPYVISAVTAEDNTDGGNPGEFYIDVFVNVSDVRVAAEQDNPGTGCFTVDEIFSSTDAYWEVPEGTDCPVTSLSAPAGDLEGAGRTYHLSLPQQDYERCSTRVEDTGTELKFHFRLVLPTSMDDTGALTDDRCYYFAPALNVQNIIVTVSKDVSAEIADEFKVFSTQLVSVTPDRCEPIELYPVPHSTLKFQIKATFPSAYGVEFTGLGLPYLEDPSNTLEWDTADGVTPSITCQEFDPDAVAASGDEYKECIFSYRSTVCEPTYNTVDGMCAFERATSRFIRNFQVRETYQGAQSYLHVSAPINTGLDNLKFEQALCDPPSERDAIDVTDEFEVSINMKNYYEDQVVDWASTDQLSFNDALIVRLDAGLTASTPFNFDNLELVLKTITITLTNPLMGDAVITSYSFTSADKSNFMRLSWSPYFQDPKFCRWYDAENVVDRCTAFFDSSTTRWNSYNDNYLDLTKIAHACQSSADTKNTDYFIFDPKEWFSDYTNAFIGVQVRATGVIHQCGPAGARRVLGNFDTGVRGLQTSGNPEQDILFVTDELIVYFNRDADGAKQVHAVERESKTFFEERKSLVIALIVVAVVIFFMILLVGFKYFYSDYNVLRAEAVSTKASVRYF